MAGKRPKQLTSKEKRKKNIKLIVQSNELVEARYMFDTWEMRFFHFFASLISKHDEEDKRYRIWLKDIRTAYKLNNNDSYHQLREAAKRLSDKSVYLNYDKDGTVREVKHRFIKFVDYIKEGQLISSSQEYVDVSIDKEMLPFLLHVQKNFDPEKTRYTSYDFRNVIELKPYSARIYQLLKKEEYRGFRVITIDEIKRQFNITNEYKRFSTLYQRIILPSLQSINEHTDITVPIDKIEKLKKGRKIYAIHVPIYGKTKKEIAFLRGEPYQQSLFNSGSKTAEQPPKETEADRLYKLFEEVIIKSFGVTPTVFMKLLNTKKFKEKHIEQAVNVTRRAKYNQEIKKNIAGFFIKALKEGYTDPKEEAKKKLQEKKKRAMLLKEAKQQLELVKEAKAQAINDKIREIVVDVPDITNQAIEAVRTTQMAALIIEAKELELGRVLELDDYRENKMLRGLVKGKIIEMKSNQFAELLQTYDTEISKLQKVIDNK